MIATGRPAARPTTSSGPRSAHATGQTTRYRGFFLVDRTKLYGFDDTTPGSFRPAVVYRQMIE